MFLLPSPHTNNNNNNKKPNSKVKSKLPIFKTQESNPCVKRLTNIHLCITRNVNTGRFAVGCFKERAPMCFTELCTPRLAPKRQDDGASLKSPHAEIRGGVLGALGRDVCGEETGIRFLPRPRCVITGARKRREHGETRVARDGVSLRPRDSCAVLHSSTDVHIRVARLQSGLPGADPGSRGGDRIPATHRRLFSHAGLPSVTPRDRYQNEPLFPSSLLLSLIARLRRVPRAGVDGEQPPRARRSREHPPPAGEQTVRGQMRRGRRAWPSGSPEACPGGLVPRLVFPGLTRRSSLEGLRGESQAPVAVTVAAGRGHPPGPVAQSAEFVTSVLYPVLSQEP